MSTSSDWIEGILIPYSTKTDDGIAIILLLCFIFSAYILGRSKKILFQQGKNFLFHKERSSLFVSSTAADMRYLLFLVVQTCILSGIHILTYFEGVCPVLFQRIPSYILLFAYILVAILYVILKWGIYSFLGWIFFDKNKVDLWLESYSTLLYYYSFALFLPILIIVYFDVSVYVVVITGLIFVIIAKILIFYKWLKLFLNKVDGVFSLILYFCALEIIPLFLYYQVLIQINSLLLIKF
ncbi:DUF4271 domain-containing protein [Bacteroides sp. 224]|uniref:DUF4271 domain-containing protein n=1 Tax=Bacteroides sp. 224 TaxID=2302936 RepID=UPI0013D6D618|nr:DUF4271 domain-containing protein [Bacteroides sp. 224]NDV65717.1 DUF4271 domain-containing protein [Bacteroides sp. 224]